MFSLSDLCFLCLGYYKNLKSVLIGNNEGLLVRKKLRYCFPEMDIDFHFEVQKYICSYCLGKLECLYKFKQTCLRSNTYLKSYFQTLTNTEETSEHLSVNFNDVQYQNKLQAVDNDQLLETDEMGTENNGICIKEEEIDIEESHLFLEENSDIVVKEEFLTFEENVDTSNHDSKYCNTNYSETSSTKPKKKEVTQKNKIKETQKFQCTVCGREFSRKIILQNHLKGHAGIKEFSCPICKKSFVQKSTLVRHEQIHAGIKNFECSICFKKFRTRCHMIAHENIHIGIKNFECSICKKKFTEKTTMVKHEKIHTGIKNFECSICKKMFGQKNNLSRHEKIHARIKNFECLICNKKFVQKCTLIKHELIHRS